MLYNKYINDFEEKLMKNCNVCNFENYDDSQFCTKCGNKIENVPPKTTKTCSRCGFENRFTDNFCAQCANILAIDKANVGNQVNNFGYNQAYSTVPVKKKNANGSLISNKQFWFVKPIIFVFISFVLILTVLFGSVSYNSPFGEGNTSAISVKQNYFQVLEASFTVSMSAEQAEKYIEKTDRKISKFMQSIDSDVKLTEIQKMAKYKRMLSKLNIIKYDAATLILDGGVKNTEHDQLLTLSLAMMLLIIAFNIVIFAVSLTYLIKGIVALAKKKVVGKEGSFVVLPLLFTLLSFLFFSVSPLFVSTASLAVQIVFSFTGIILLTAWRYLTGENQPEIRSMIKSSVMAFVGFVVFFLLCGSTVMFVSASDYSTRFMTLGNALLFSLSSGLNLLYVAIWSIPVVFVALGSMILFSMFQSYQLYNGKHKKQLQLGSIITTMVTIVLYCVLIYAIHIIYILGDIGDGSVLSPSGAVFFSQILLIGMLIFRGVFKANKLNQSNMQYNIGVNYNTNAYANNQNAYSGNVTDSTVNMPNVTFPNINVTVPNAIDTATDNVKPAAAEIKKPDVTALTETDPKANQNTSSPLKDKSTQVKEGETASYKTKRQK